MPFDYEKEAAVTMSEEFHGDLVPALAFRYALGNAIGAIQELDRIKKALFYGRKYLHFQKDFLSGCEQFLSEFASDQRAINIIHGILGVATEAGEMLELLRDVINGNKEFDALNMREECGDNLWYLALLARELGETLSGIQRANIAKLRTRYPNKFNEFDANHRNLDEEKNALNGFLGEK